MPPHLPSSFPPPSTAREPGAIRFHGATQEKLQKGTQGSPGEIGRAGLRRGGGANMLPYLPPSSQPSLT